LASGGDEVSRFGIAAEPFWACQLYRQGMPPGLGALKGAVEHVRSLAGLGLLSKGHVNIGEIYFGGSCGKNVASSL
jgi:hypothetical protein